MVYKLLLLLSLWFKNAIPQHVTVRHKWNNLRSQTHISNWRFLLVCLSNITQTHRCCKADLASTFPPVQISRIQCAGCSITGTKSLPVQHIFTNSILLPEFGQPSKNALNPLPISKVHEGTWLAVHMWQQMLMFLLLPSGQTTNGGSIHLL